MRSKIAFGAAIFLGAFLLFQIEPIIAKRILPWFGGVAAVWIVCLLFFQIVLLLGYAYAAWLNAKFSPRSQGWLHAVLLAVSLAALRVYPADSWKPTPNLSPMWHILLLLAATVGLPYFLLSATSPLLQAWYAAEHDSEPYRFYSLSNIGSMLALLSYPVVVEPRLTTKHQTVVWSIAYVAFAILCAAIALRPRSVAPSENENASPGAGRTGWSVRLAWLALAACGSALLLSVTNHISQNIASVPLLWIIPLSLYLLSFIAAFGSPWLYPRGFFLRALGVALGGMTYALSPSFAQLPVKIAIPLFCLGLFIACMFCHGELARLRPAARELTSFYLFIAAGGAIGGLFVALAAPHIFTGYYELHVALGLCAVLVVVVHALDPESIFSLRKRTIPGFGLAALATALMASLAVNVRNEAATARVSVRNFYGVLRVEDGTAPNIQIIQGNSIQKPDGDSLYRSLLNGTINHGIQFYAESRRRLPTTYYGPNSGIGVALAAIERGAEPVRVGIIGLGAGSTAVYGRTGDHFTYYEINPLDIRLAEEQFTYLKDSPAEIDIVEGDARLSLERPPPQKFDLLAADAFSGDSVPVHLLTREAFELYFRQLKPDGVLAINISNGYVDLQPVVVSAADALGKEAIFFHNDDDHPNGIFASNWMIVGDPAKFEGQNAIEGKGLIVLPGTKKWLWTDDFSNLFEVLK